MTVPAATATTASCVEWTSKPWMRSWRVKTKGSDEAVEAIDREGETETETETTDAEAAAVRDGTTIDAAAREGTTIDGGTENRHRRDRVGCPRATWMKTDDRRTADSARGVA
jgi:hypothetical protein